MTRVETALLHYFYIADIVNINFQYLIQGTISIVTGYCSLNYALDIPSPANVVLRLDH